MSGHVVAMGGAAAVFLGNRLVDVVAGRRGAGGYRVSTDGEEPLAARLLRP